MGWLAVAAVAAFPVVEAVRILVQRPHVVMYGDQALLELGARRAAHLDQLVGPYSRNGFHHLGPAVLYLLAPFVRFLEPSGPGLYLGAVAINGGALVATVAVLWRRLGPRAAVWAAAAIDLCWLCVGVGTLREPWNPYLVVAPMILFVVLWAAGFTGSSGAAVWALVAGSYEVQTHIATAPVVIAMSALLLVRRAVRRHRRGRDRDPSARWTPAPVSGAAALALIWLPPVVELWRDRPNNFTLLRDFLTSPPATPPVSRALQVAAGAVSIVPFGNHDYVLTLHRSGAEIAITAALLVAGLLATISVARRRHQPMSVALAAGAVLGVVVGTLSLTHTDGPIYPYFAVWLAYVPLSVLIALGTALLGSTGPEELVASDPVRGADIRQGSAGRWPVIVLCLVALAGAASTVTSDLRMGSVSTTTGSGPWPPGNAGAAEGKQQTIRNTIALTRAAESVLGSGDRTVGITIESTGVWPYVAGMVLDLDERGVQSTVAPRSWELYFGHERVPRGPVSVAFSLYPSRAAAALDPSAGRVIADLDDAVLTYRRPGA